MSRFVYWDLLAGVGLIFAGVACYRVGEGGGSTDSDTENTLFDTSSESYGESDPDTAVDDDTDSDVATDSNVDTDNDTGVMALHPCDRPADHSVANGDYCYENSHCQSNLCVSYQQTPPDPEGHCEEGSDQMLAIGTTLDLATGEPIPEVETMIIGEMRSSTAIPVYPLLELVTGPDGRFKQEMPHTRDMIGLAVATQKWGYHDALAGVAQPLSINTADYPPGFTRHDILLVKSAALTEWSETLFADDEMVKHMPLGEKRTAIGSVRCIDSGNPVVGAELRSLNAGSNAKIRYLAADGAGFNTDAITESGIFMMVNAGTAEKFDVYMDERKISTHSVRITARDGYIYTVGFPIECDEMGIEDCSN